MGGKAWTKEEDTKLLREYKEKGAIQLQKEFEGRTLAAIRNRYSYLTKKPQKKKKIKKIDKCPFCGSWNINKVMTWVGNARYGYYCIDCLTEFTLQGECIPPLYAKGMEG